MLNRDEDKQAQSNEGKERRVRSEKLYSELIDKINEFYETPDISIAEIVRRIGLGPTSEANIKARLKDKKGYLRGDNLLALLDMCGALIFFPDEEMPITQESLPTDDKKIIRALEKTIAAQDRVIRIYEDQLKIKNN